MQWLGLGPQAAPLEGRVINDMLTELATPDADRVADYTLYERYYDGDHNVRLTDRERQYMRRSGLPWSENFCETIVDTMAERLTVTDFLCEDDEAAQEWAQGWWEGDANAEVAGTVHTQAPLKGDGFLGVDWNAEHGAAVLSWNDPACCTPVYNASGELLMVAKTWNESTPTPTNPTGKLIKRLNLYLPDRIEKWFTFSDGGSGAEWLMHMDNGDTAWPTAWVRADGTPRGVGIVHFRNKPKGRDFGRSELRSTIPQNDILNKQIIDLANILDNQGWDQRWATGVSEKRAAELRHAPGSVWATPNENAKFGQFTTAEVTGALEAIEATLRRISGRSKTPMHLLYSGAITQLPSGESLKTAESGLTFKVKDRQPGYGLSWSTSVAIAAGLEADFGSELASYAGAPFATQWESAASRNEKSEWDIAEQKGRVGVSRQTRLEEMGYDPDKEAERRKEEAEENARNFDAGLGGGNPAGGDPKETEPPVPA